MYEWAEKKHQPITNVFLDIKKAYDSVERAAESPLTWIIFFDMILSRLRQEGVGASTETSSADGNWSRSRITRRSSKPLLS